MGLDNRAVPKYYSQFKQDVLSGKIPVNEHISQEMNRIDALIDNPGVYYDEEAIEGWVRFCEAELTLTDGSEVHLLPSFKLWGEQVFGWYYFIERSVYVPNDDGGGTYVKRIIKKRLTFKQFLIVARGAAKSMYISFIQAYFLCIDRDATQQITTAPTMRQAEEVITPIKTAIARSRGPLFKFLTAGSLQNTTGNSKNRPKLVSTKLGIQHFLTNSILKVLPMSIDKMQGLRPKVSSVDEWLSGDVREDVIGSIEQGASKMDDYFILAVSSEGTVRNSSGDTVKMELLSILRGEYINPHTSIFYYRLDDIEEVNDPTMWVKANPNLGLTVTYDVYQQDVEKAEKVPSQRNDILAKRFGIPMEGYTYYFTYEETIPHTKKSFWSMPCSLGVDLSKGDDFCAFTFLFPDKRSGYFGVKTLSYITEVTLHKLPTALREKYNEFIQEGSLRIMGTTVLDMNEVYEDLEEHIDANGYEVMTMGFDPYNAEVFVNRWVQAYGEFGVEKVKQGARTESVPLGELKVLAGERKLLFDESLMSFTMGNAITLEDTNGNRKLYKLRQEEKIDNVAALMDAYVAYKRNAEAFE